MQLSLAVVLGLFIIPPAALALVVSPKPITHAVDEAATSFSATARKDQLSKEEEEELRRETLEEEKKLFGHTEEEVAAKEAKEAKEELEEEVKGDVAKDKSKAETQKRTKANEDLKERSEPPARVAVLVVGHVDRYLPKSTIDLLVGSGVKSGLAVDYYAALAGPAVPHLEQQVAAWVASAGGQLGSFSMNHSAAPTLLTGNDEWRPSDSQQLALLWPKVKAKELSDGLSYRQVVLVREDAYWISDPSSVWYLPVTRAYSRACANDGGQDVAFVLPRKDADSFLSGYANFLSGKSESSVKQQLPSEVFLLDLADDLGLEIEGLDGAQLPVVPAGRAGGFEDACAVDVKTDGCNAPPQLAECQKYHSFSIAPCADGSNRCHSAKQMLPPAKVLKLYQLSHLVDLVLEANGIWHVATSGTLLGAVRNKGIIPHDDDVDYNIMKVQQTQLQGWKFKAALRKNGMYLKKVHDDFWKIAFTSMPTLEVDIFGLVQIGSWLTYPNNWWPGTKWPLSIRNTPGAITRWKFGTSTVPAPSSAITMAFLSRKFGPSWKTEVACKPPLYHKCSTVTNTHWDLTGRALPDHPLIEPVGAKTLTPRQAFLKRQKAAKKKGPLDWVFHDP